MVPLGKQSVMLFQVCGSPHVHCFLWVMNAPVLNSDNKEGYVAFVYQIIHAFLPDGNENPELHELVKFYQLHRHSKTCRKYNNDVCRFKFGEFFTKRKLQNHCQIVCRRNESAGFT